MAETNVSREAPSLPNVKSQIIDPPNTISKSPSPELIIEVSDNLQNSRSITNTATEQSNITMSEEDSQCTESLVWILSFLNIFHCSLLTPNGIKCDNVRREFFVKRANCWLKIVNFIWLFCLAIYMIIFFLNELDQQYTVEVITGKLSWACYTLFDFTIIVCLQRNGDKIANLLTEGNKISSLLEHLSNRKTNKRKGCIYFFRRQHIKWLILWLTVTYTTFFVLFVTTEFTASTTNFYSLFLDLTSHNRNGSDVEDGKYEDLYYPCTSEKQVVCNLFVRFASCFYASVLLVAWFLLAFTIELMWTVFLLMTAAFGYYFKRMFTNCIEAIERGEVDLLQGIKIYTRISLMLDDFNKIFGYPVLWIVLASILWFPAMTRHVMLTSSILGELLAGFNNGLMFEIANISACVPILVTLYTASELHKTGDILPSLIKKRFLRIDKIREDEEKALQLGCSVVQFDTLASNIGLKGAGFFTISYTFVGSMVGIIIIITYTLVTVQFTMK